MKYKTYTLTFLIIFLAVFFVFAQQQPQNEPTTAPKTGELDETGSILLKKIDPSVVTIQHEKGLGSGYIITPDGYIITNGHVVALFERDMEDPKEIAKFITVIMSDDKRYLAQVIGHSLDPDVALIKINPETPLTAIELGNSDAVKAGQRVYAYGSPGGLKRTLTAGILSNIERTDLGTFTRVFQTDAPINPGNSGGPLLNEKGEAIGMNTYGGGGEGIGFAIPINVIKVLKEHFLKYGRFKRADLPVFFLRHLDDDLAYAFGVDKGILVNYVEDDSYVSKAGLKTGDIIIEIDGEKVSARTAAELSDIIWNFTCREVGSSIKLKILRPQISRNTKEITEHIIEAKLLEDEPAVESRYQLGEISELRYDNLGLGVKIMTAMTQYIYEFAHRQGVRVVRVEPNSAAAKADIQRQDMITGINNILINTIDDFQKELERSLSAKQKFIMLTLYRHNGTIKTALKPFYDLAPAGKPRKIILLCLPSHEKGDFESVRKFLITNGAEFIIASKTKQVTTSNPKSQITVDITLEELVSDPQNILPGINAVIFMTGDDIKDYWNDTNVIKLIKNCLDNKKVIGAIGGASVALINADAGFISKKITTAEEYSSVMLEKKANYTGKEVQADGLLITTTGFDKKTVKSFLNALKGILRSFEK
ncbi:MAG: trypsin-like peptidase domain-containing protein [Planctomycetota bacterium]